MPGPPILTLRLDPAPDGGWDASVQEGLGRPRRTAIPAHVVRGIAEAVGALEAVKAPTLLASGADRRFVEAERELAERLGALLLDLHPHRALLPGAPNVGPGPSLVLAVDAPDPAIGRLPWELAGAGRASLEELGGVVIVRVAAGVPGAPRLSAGERLDVVAWSPTPEDRVCAEALADLGRGPVGRTFAVRTLPPAPGPAGSPGADVPFALHLVCHGHLVAGRVLLSLEGGLAEVDDLARGLAPWVRRAQVVVLVVCHGAAAVEDELDSLAVRLCGSGARACAAPTRSLHVRAARAFTEAFYARIAAGDSLADCARDARGAVALLGLPHASARWYQLGLTVVDVNDATAELLPASWQPEGWPRPSPDAAAWLTRALSTATHARGGYVGVEHLARALVVGPEQAGAGWRMRSLLSPHVDRLDALTASLKRVREGDAATAEPAATPRLRRLGAALSPGFSVADLAIALTRDPCHLLHEVASLGSVEEGAAGLDRLPPEATLRGGTFGPGDAAVARTWPEAPGAVEAFEVVGGPEDGRVLALTPEQWIGRASSASGQAHALYADTTLIDAQLSRRAARWMGGGRLDLARPGVVSKDGVASVQEGVVALCRGDLVTLSPGTRLRARGREDQPSDRASRTPM